VTALGYKNRKKIVRGTLAFLSAFCPSIRGSLDCDIQLADMSVEGIVL